MRLLPPPSPPTLPLVPILLALLAVYDLRAELMLLVDHFTWTSLLTGLREHPLSVTVLALLPSLWKRY